MKTRTFRKILRTLLVATLSLAGVLGVGYVVVTMIPFTFPEYEEPDFEEIGQAATRLVEHYFPLTRWGGMELHKIEFHHVEERLESRGHETGTMVVSLLHNRGEPGYETHPDPDGRDRPWARRFDSNSVYTIPIAPDRRVRFHDIQRHGILDVRMSAASAQRETMSPEAGE